MSNAFETPEQWFPQLLQQRPDLASDIRKVAAKVTVNPGRTCWKWNGPPKVWFQGRQIPIQRLLALWSGINLPASKGGSWEQCIGTDCDDPDCVNPAHFSLKTRSEVLNERYASEIEARLLDPSRAEILEWLRQLPALPPEDMQDLRRIYSHATIVQAGKWLGCWETPVSFHHGPKMAKDHRPEPVRRRAWEARHGTRIEVGTHIGVCCKNPRCIHPDHIIHVDPRVAAKKKDPIEAITHRLILDVNTGLNTGDNSNAR